MKDAIMKIGFAVLATLLMIIMSIIMFIITLFIIQVAADVVFDVGVSTDWAVLSAAILTIGSAVGGGVIKFD